MFLLLNLFAIFTQSMDQGQFISKLNIPNSCVHSEHEYRDYQSLISKRKKIFIKENITIKDDEIGRYTIEEAGQLLKLYPISRETFDHIMSHSEEIIPALKFSPLLTYVNPETPVVLKASLNRLEGLAIANNIINQIRFSSIDIPCKEAMLFSTKKGKIMPCVASHKIIGDEPTSLSLKHVQDLYILCKKAKAEEKEIFNFMDVQPKNFVASKYSDKIFLIDTGLEGFDEQPRKNFNGFIADYIRYQFHGRLQNDADQFLINKVNKHKST